MSQDLYQAPDYFQMDELLTEEHKLIRDAAREWVKREVSPIIEEACQKAEFPKQILKGLGEIGGFGPYIPLEYGGAGLDQISYGLIMQELERGDSGIRSTSSVNTPSTSVITNLIFSIFILITFFITYIFKWHIISIILFL